MKSWRLFYIDVMKGFLIFVFLIEGARLDNKYDEGERETTAVARSTTDLPETSTMLLSKCETETLELHLQTVTKNSAEINWTTPPSWGDECNFQEDFYTLIPEGQSNGSCAIPKKICSFSNLKELTNYTFKAEPVFSDGRRGIPAYLSFLLVRPCIPKDEFHLSIENNVVNSQMNETYSKYLHHYDVTVKIDQSLLCGGRNFTFSKTRTEGELHNLQLNSSYPGEWKICLKPFQKNQVNKTCKNEKCSRYNVSSADDLLKIVDFNLTATEGALTAEWSTNHFWPSNCSVDHYKVGIKSAHLEPAEKTNYCKKNICKENLINLHSNETYTIEIKPVFVGHIDGIALSRTGTPLTCPQYTNDVKIELVNSEFLLSFPINDPTDHFTIQYLTKPPCEDDYYVPTAHSPPGYHLFQPKFQEISPFFDVKFYVESVKRADEMCPKIKAFGELIAAQNLFLNMKTIETTESSARISWMVPDGWNLVNCSVEIYLATSSGGLTSSCNYDQKICELSNLDKNIQYNTVFQPVFKNGRHGSPTSVSFFTLGKCIPKDEVSLSFADKDVKWSLKDQRLEPFLDSYEVSIKIDRKKTCGGHEFQYRNYKDINHIGSIRATNLIIITGTLTVCIKPILKHQPSTCDNQVCNSKYFKASPDLLGVTIKDITPVDRSLKVQWTPNDFLINNCTLQHYEIFTISDGFPHSKMISMCDTKLCTETIANLRPDVDYTVKIIPVFEGNITGTEAIGNKYLLINCPVSISDLEISYKNGNFDLYWDYVSNHSADYFEIAYNCRTPCETNYTFGSIVNATTMSYKVGNLPNHLDVKFSIRARKFWDDQKCLAAIVEKEMSATRSIPLEINDLSLNNVSETSAVVTWRNPRVLKAECKLLVVVTLTNSKITTQNCTSTSCHIWDLKPFSNYSVQVQACETTHCPLSTLNFTTLDLYPKIPENILSVDYSDFDNFVSFHSVFTPNINCSIEYRNVMTKDSRVSRDINCVNNGSIRNSELENDAAYEVSYVIANTRGRNSSHPPLIVYTPPKKQPQVFQINKDETASNSTVITLLFTAINGTFHGTIYLVVSDGILDAKLCENLVKHRKKSSLNTTANSRRKRRSAAAKNYFLLDETLPLGTPKYDLQSDYLKTKDLDVNFGKYVTPVVDYQSGGYSTVVGYESNGPFWFDGSNAAVNWTVSLSFVVFAILLILMIRRKKINLPKLPMFYKHRGRGVTNSSPTYESSQNNVDVDCELEEEATNQAVQLHLLRERQIDSISTQDDENLCDEEEEIYGNVSPKVYIEDLEFFLIQNAHSPKLQEEYKSVPLIIPGKSIKVSKISRNRTKNRYQNNPPYDDTRIVLPPNSHDPNSDYINANYIDIVVDESGAMARYIPTQGPMDHRCDTVTDFWRMIWHEKVEAIIMVTNLVENGKLKCAQYWPEFGELLQVNDMEVIQDEAEEDRMGCFIIRKFEITRNGEYLRVAQYHYVEWPDHGVPLEAAPLGQMIKIILANHPFGPTVIHCSAGIGRTGTLLLVILCMEELKLLKFLNMKKCFLRLRNCRPKLIQNFSQYQFAHYLLWVILFEHKTTFSNDDFVSSWYALTNSSPPNKSYNLEEQFVKLKTFNKELTYTKAKKNDVKKFNRYANVLPADSRRVILYKGLTDSESDQYVNAVEIDGFNQQNAYIVAEHPLPETLERIWIMVLERQIPVWVLLNQYPDDDPNFLPVLPDEIEKCFSLGAVSIEFIVATDYEYFRETTVRVYSHSEYYPDISFDTKVLQLYGWKGGNELPSTGPDGLHSLLNYIRSIGPFTNPIFFSCLDGLTACGLALALDITRFRAETFQEVSIFSSCIKITYNRPEFIVSKEQYQYLHDAMASYFIMQNEETYADIDEIF